MALQRWDAHTSGLRCDINSSHGTGTGHCRTEPVNRLNRKVIHYQQPGWWLNQRLWKICSSKWVRLPQKGINIQKKNYLKPPPSYVLPWLFRRHHIFLIRNAKASCMELAPQWLRKTAVDLCDNTAGWFLSHSIWKMLRKLIRVCFQVLSYTNIFIETIISILGGGGWGESLIIGSSLRSVYLDMLLHFNSLFF